MLQLTRRLASIDLETTGLNPQTDSIVQIGVVFLDIDGSQHEWQTLVNPLKPIPPSASEVHGIIDADVSASPTFREVASTLLFSLEGCDLAGYALIPFDLPFLIEEFKRVGHTWDPYESRLIVDAQQIFFMKEKRTLEAALRFYCNISHPAAHDALGDAKASLQVLDGQQVKYKDMPSSLEEIVKWSLPEGYVDPEGKLKLNSDGLPAFAFGKKHFGHTLDEVAQTDSSYLTWILSESFNPIVKRFCQEALNKTKEGMLQQMEDHF